MAPVLIGTYTRLQHLRQTVEALAANYNASSTDLYVASDFPKDLSDVIAVEEVRRYIETISGFASVNKIFRDKNLGTTRNFVDAANMILRSSNEIIIMEDDIVTGRGFLDFMNDALSYYRDDESVLAVSGYLWPELVFKGDASLLLPAYNTWGWGTWRNRYKDVESLSGLSNEVFHVISLFYRVLLTNPNLLPMAFAAAKGKLCALDLDWNLLTIKQKKFSVFPPQSLVKNIGFDGTGVNCGNDGSFDSHYINRYGSVRVAPPNNVDFDMQRKILFRGLGGWSNVLRVIMAIAVAQLPDLLVSKLRKIKAVSRSFLDFLGSKI
jgi:hypothetical protein